MAETEIKNAIIESASMDMGGRGLLTAWLHLNYGGSGQGFGGYTLYLPKDFKHHADPVNYAGHFIFRCLQIAGVEEWSALPGKTIRVDVDHGGIVRIGHIIKEDWFDPKAEFQALRKKIEVPA